MTESDCTPELLSITEVAKMLNTSNYIVRRMIETGELDYIDLGTTTKPFRRIDAAQVRAMLMRRRVTRS